MGGDQNDGEQVVQAVGIGHRRGVPLHAASQEEEVRRRDGGTDDSTGKLLETTELKGLDIVRRDWSQLAADAGRKVISLIMCDSSEDVRLAAIQEHLEAIKVQLLEKL